jgi:hypothetical protein
MEAEDKPHAEVGERALRWNTAMQFQEAVSY